MSVTSLKKAGCYNVECNVCGQIFTPRVEDPLWWQAKKAADAGRLDALRCSGEECGCIPPRVRPDAPFRVFGYDCDCCAFDFPCSTFVEAIETYRAFNNGIDTIFIKGVSEAVESRLEFGS